MKLNSETRCYSKRVISESKIHKVGTFSNKERNHMLGSQKKKMKGKEGRERTSHTGISFILLRKHHYSRKRQEDKIFM